MRTSRWFRLATAGLVAVVSVSFSAGVVGSTATTVDASSRSVLPQRTLHSTLAVGGKHTCAVVGAGAVWCWGNNSWGQLGNGSTTDSTNPVAVNGLTTARSIAAGSVHTCALMAAGSVACWGTQGDEWSIEKAGWNGITHSDRPITVGGVTSATAIAASGYMTCALVSRGTVKCWGSYQQTPLTIAGISGATAISVAYQPPAATDSRSRACALLGDGTVHCWGFTIRFPQFYGIVPTTVTASIQIPGINTAVALRGNCALLRDGSVRCWTETNGHLSSASVAGVSDAVALSVGFADHACAVLRDSTARCWGDNHTGQLGNHTTRSSLSGVAVAGLTNATEIATGSDGYCSFAGDVGDNCSHTCALLSDGAMRCWGSNSFGQLGAGTTATPAAPVAVAGLTGAIALSAGDDHSCALLADHTVRCWGGNTIGQLGDGTTVSSTAPVAVAGLTGATAISARGAHTCALLANTTVKCWGLGFRGSSSTAGSTTAVVVAGLGSVVAIGTGDVHMCAVLSNGTVQCLGSNTYGQLGDGTTTDSANPVLMHGISNAIAVSAGRDFTCVLLADHTVECAQQSSPIASAVPGMVDVTAITAGAFEACALRSDGTVACWPHGLPLDAPPGFTGVTTVAADLHARCATLIGQTVTCWSTDAYTVAPLAGLSGVTSIAAGWDHFCGLLTNTAVKCWGNNASGQLGNGPWYRTPLIVRAVSGVRQPTPTLTVPWAPAAPTTTPGHTRVTLAWTAPSNGGQPITDYVVQYSADNGHTWRTYLDGVHPSTGATITGLTPRHAYRFRIRAINPAGTSPYSTPSTSSRPT